MTDKNAPWHKDLIREMNRLSEKHTIKTREMVVALLSLACEALRQTKASPEEVATLFKDSAEVYAEVLKTATFED